jgi:plastocyanin
MANARLVLLLVRGALVLTVGASGAQALAAGSIKGSVKLEGKAPERKEVVMQSDAFCATRPATKDEEVVVGAKGELKNVVVRIAKGLATLPPPPAGHVMLDQNGCAYRPRVVVAQAGQQVELRNSDQTLHNIHTYRGKQTLFNEIHIQGSPNRIKPVPKVGDVVKFKCDVHPWMTAWLLVTDNPFFAVTGDDGKFEIPQVPPGKYTVEIWHERYGSQTRELTVADGKPAELKLSFKAD